MDPIANLVADLQYRAYEHARDKSPDITPQSWKAIWGNDVDLFEARYQADKMIARVMG